ncbi:hypothetical protein, partial [Pseudomonas silesiensis]|uniref:hypothetical protein n=1 Tax=Pseudomonas silesiensis TaxID=1853130 RepID=UPI0034D76579
YRQLRTDGLKKSRTLSPAHRWIAKTPNPVTCVQMDCENAEPCRSRLAGEGVFMGGAWLEAAFAGKPAPT